MSLLPQGFKKLEYIESTGTQYINTGFKANTGTTRIEFYGGYTYNSGMNTQALIAAYDSTPNWYCVYNWSNQNDYIIFNSAVGTAHWVNIAGKNINMHHIIMDSYTGQYIYDDTVISTWAPVSHEQSVNLFLFGYSSSTQGTVQLATAKLYYCKIYNSGTLVCNFIPAIRTSDSEVGMYDTVTSTFFTNAGTGNFIAGPYVENEHVCGVRKIYHKTANLFDKDNVNWIYGINPTKFTFLQHSMIAYNGGYEANRTFYISCKPLTTYTLVFDNSYTKRLADIATVPVVNDFVNNFVDNFEDSTKIYTTSATANYMIVQLYINGDFDAGARSADIISGLMIVEGSVAPSGYIPYGNAIYTCYKSFIKTSVLPSEYTELEYIQATGTGTIARSLYWINTGITGSLDTEIETDIAHIFSDSTSLLTPISSAKSNTSGIAVSHYSLGPASAWATRFGNQAWNNQGTIISGTKYHIVFNKDTFTVDGTEHTIAATAQTNTSNIYLMSDVWPTVVPSTISLRMGITIIRKNGTVVFNGHPVRRNSDSEIGMYDLVNGVFYTNQGTGTFTAGPEVTNTTTYTLYKRLITA